MAKRKYGEGSVFLRKDGRWEGRIIIGYNENGNPKTLAGILGHTNASFTLDTYTHVTSDMQKSASLVVGNMIKNIMIKE